MIIRKKKLYNYIILVITLVISGIMMFATDSIIINVLSMIVIFVSVAILNKFNFMHPSIWFGFFLVLYSISFPVLYEIGDLSAASTGYDSQAIKVSWIALITFLMTAGFTKNQKYNIITNKNKRKLIYMIDSSKLIFKISLVLMSIIIIFINIRGIGSKADLFLNDSLHSFIALTITTLMLSFLIVYLYNIIILKKKIKTKVLLIVGFSVLFYLFTGERDIIFKLMLILTMVNFSFGYLKKKHLFLIGTSSIFMVPLLLNFGIREGTFDPTQYISSDSPFLIMLNTLLRSEFGSASKNTQVIVQAIKESDYLYLKPFFSAFAEFPLLPNLTGFRSIQWYYESFYPNRPSGTGVGFSLVGEGYLSFGVAGVIFWFAFLGLLFRYLYNKSKNDVIIFSIYILTIPSAIYSIRASLLVIVTGLTRHVMVLVAFAIVGEIIKYKSKDTYVSTEME